MGARPWHPLRSANVNLWETSAETDDSEIKRIEIFVSLFTSTMNDIYDITVNDREKELKRLMK